ncbi:MAG TPA: SRPBCC family protein [Lysobacter sp.]|nr:SRPBCC family protein [Lysobacter sp.]
MNDAFAVPLAADTLRIERVLPGPIERVWAYLTESDKRARWLADGPLEPLVGGRVQLVFRNNALTEGDDAAPAKYAAIAEECRTGGRVTACEPPHVLAFTWDEDGDEASEVCFELQPAGDAVRLTVTHRRLARRDARISVAAGWHTHLDILQARLTGHAPEGFWRRHTRLEAEYERRLPA